MPGTRAPAVRSVLWSLAAMLAPSACAQAPGPLAAVTRLAATTSTVDTGLLDSNFTFTVLSCCRLDAAAARSRRASAGRDTLPPAGARR
jgi:hypothetical protein